MTRFDSPAGAPDAAAILNSVGEAAYEWWLDSNALSWSGNVAAVVGATAAGSPSSPNTIRTPAR